MPASPSVRSLPRTRSALSKAAGCGPVGPDVAIGSDTIDVLLEKSACRMQDTCETCTQAAMMAPFVVFSSPRSRTFWLSKFLSVGGWHCGHEELRYARDLGDVKTWLAMPRTGTVETAASPFWRTLRDLAPDARVVILIQFRDIAS
jgi:hypothetical protein